MTLQRVYGPYTTLGFRQDMIHGPDVMADLAGIKSNYSGKSSHMPHLDLLLGPNTVNTPLCLRTWTFFLN